MSTLPGEGRVHDCLRSKRQQLTDNCRKEELLLEEQEAENIKLRPGIMKVWGVGRVRWEREDGSACEC